MQAQGPKTPYEVYCHRCNVSCPAGERHCVHCGGRLSRERGHVVEFPTAFEEGEGPPEQEAPRRSPFSPVALVWILLFVGGTVYRACAEG